MSEKKNERKAAAETETVAAAETETVAAAETETVAAAETETAEVAQKEPEEMEVYVPKGYSAEDTNLLVSINGKNYVLPRGKKVMVPAAVAKEVQRAERAQQIYDSNVAARVQATKNSAVAAGLK